MRGADKTQGEGRPVWEAAKRQVQRAAKGEKPARRFLNAAPRGQRRGLLDGDVSGVAEGRGRGGFVRVDRRDGQALFL